ncbi:hypothetical protein ASPWEDRAFT_26826 [Aspergillus wentii DTO 134E9]|uniref:Uncharacterized protein n=1 Tax=Aspergillus wentii DTO 134E9 TaxID=1073089 RepID=A0A1L9RR72_ASPWE|nr:uncharacterized protein ASPWEDRAFT_26826 [Aspergillus wentii DTO 134E9]KAI9928087.1 hypothetical protein MW887_002120 [Aspergillus wentii]OJJ37435.1 hypothetical protein ASPWEDRAFT_26826 [Aspergillus wentii DTO 134E9]
MTTTLERSLSRTSSMSIPMSSPRLSVRREITPPSISEPSSSHVHDRLNLIDARLMELRSAVLTKDAYADRRNREDDHIRREFEAHRSISNRIDLNVVALRTDVDQLKSGVFQLKSSIGQSGNETVFLRSDVDRLQKNIDQVQTDLEQLQTDVCGCRIEISKLHSTISQLRTDLITLQHETSRHLNAVFDRFSLIESRMKHSERVRFNSLAHTTHAPITPVPTIDEDGTMQWPEYFPRTVWRFWCLKKRSRIHRLVQMADFYQLGGYQYWSRMHHTEPMFGGDSDSSESSDCSSNITRAEAVRQYPEAAHQALAATLGLVYYKIRNEVGEGPNALIAPRPPKRQQEEMASATSSSKQKPVKMARRPNNVSPTALHKIYTGPSIESKSLASDESDKLGWNAHSEYSDEAIHKLQGVVSEVGTLLRALEQGRRKLKPSRSERLNMSPTASKAPYRNGEAAGEPAQDDETRTEPNTVPTEVISPSSAKTEDHELPDTASNAISPLT